MSAPDVIVRPPGVSLLFCSQAAIDAAPAAEREAYYAIVDAIVEKPENFGLRLETGDDLSNEFAADRRIAGEEQDWA